MPPRVAVVEPTAVALGDVIEGRIASGAAGDWYDARAPKSSFRMAVTSVLLIEFEPLKSFAKVVGRHRR